MGVPLDRASGPPKRPWSLAGDLLQYCLPPLPRGQYLALSFRPLILLVKDYAVNHPRANVLHLLRHLRRHRPHVYYATSWHVHPGLVDHHLQKLRLLERACPHLGVTVLGQTEAETALFAARGLDALFCNQNAHADERVFRPLPGIEPEFDAIYDAQPAAYKRHALAAGISSLALIGYRNHGTADPRYAAETLRMLPQARWLNDPNCPPDRWRLTDEDVNRAYNRCRVGLCLSAVEGAMWVSVQYLLAGLPVVTTPNEGGRDEFFEAPHVRTAEPTPEAVAEAVAHLVAECHDPWAIRRRTLELMAGHRARFIAHVQALFDQAGERRPFVDEYRRVVPHRLVDITLVGRRRRKAIREHDRRIIAGADQGLPAPTSEA